MAAIALAFAADAVWVALMQNPDHLRHLAPLAVLGGLLVVLVPRRGDARPCFETLAAQAPQHEAGRIGGAPHSAGASRRVRGLFGMAPIILLLALNVFTVARTLDPTPGAAPPLARAADVLRRAPAGSAVALNEGVAVLRAALPAMHVYDMQAPADAALGLASARGAAFRLSTTPLDSVPLAVFAGRAAGEETMYLYRVGRGGKGLQSPAE
jgi:hypothetical protein